MQLEKRLAADGQRAQDDDVALDRDRDHVAPIGKATLAEQLEQSSAAAQETVTPVGKQAVVDDYMPPPAHLSSYRANAAREVVDALPATRSGSRLARATIAALNSPWQRSAEARTLAQVVDRRAATLYRHAVDEGHDVHDPAVDAALAQAGSGQTLPEQLRKRMEAELGYDLARVRIHTGSVAAHAARAVRAHAFTVGEDIFFAAGSYAPDSAAGAKLIAHELTHVVQAWQGRARTPSKGREVSNPNESLEREAESFADRFAAKPAKPIAARPAATPTKTARGTMTLPSFTALATKVPAAVIAPPVIAAPVGPGVLMRQASPEPAAAPLSEEAAAEEVKKRADELNQAATQTQAPVDAKKLGTYDSDSQYVEMLQQIGQLGKDKLKLKELADAAKADANVAKEYEKTKRTELAEIKKKLKTLQSAKKDKDKNADAIEAAKLAVEAAEKALGVAKDELASAKAASTKATKESWTGGAKKDADIKKLGNTGYARQNADRVRALEHNQWSDASTYKHLGKAKPDELFDAIDKLNKSLDFNKDQLDLIAKARAFATKEETLTGDQLKKGTLQWNGEDQIVMGGIKLDGELKTRLDKFARFLGWSGIVAKAPVAGQAMRSPQEAHIRAVKWMFNLGKNPKLLQRANQIKLVANFATLKGNDNRSDSTTLIKDRDGNGWITEKTYMLLADANDALDGKLPKDAAATPTAHDAVAPAPASPAPAPAAAAPATAKPAPKDKNGKAKKPAPSAEALQMVEALKAAQAEVESAQTVVAVGKSQGAQAIDGHKDLDHRLPNIVLGPISNHCSGLAVDMTIDWELANAYDPIIDAVAAYFGLYRPVKDSTASPEFWHFEKFGSPPGTSDAAADGGGGGGGGAAPGPAGGTGKKTADGAKADSGEAPHPTAAKPPRSAHHKRH